MFKNLFTPMFEFQTHVLVLTNYSPTPYWARCQMLRTRNNYSPSVSLLFKKPTVIVTTQQDIKCA